MELVETMGSFRARMDAWDRAHILLAPRMKRILLKLLAIRFMIGERHFSRLAYGTTNSEGQRVQQATPRDVVEHKVQVARHVEGTGRLQGMLGALECGMDGRPYRGPGDGFEVGIGFSELDRNLETARLEWPVDSCIVVSYEELNAEGVPLFPVYVRKCSAEEAASGAAYEDNTDEYLIDDRDGKQE